MADEIDKANEQAQLILDKKIAIVRHDINPYQNQSGICWECEQEVYDGRRWCSIECCRASERGV